MPLLPRRGTPLERQNSFFVGGVLPCTVLGHAFAEEALQQAFAWAKAFCARVLETYANLDININVHMYTSD
jgi:hypothetical protein